MQFKGHSIFDVIKNMVNNNTFLNQDQLKLYVRDLARDVTFKEVYDQNGWILNITVSDTTFPRNQQLLCNYLTTPDVLLWSACIASCAIPDIYDPVELMIKNKRG